MTPALGVGQPSSEVMTPMHDGSMPEEIPDLEDLPTPPSLRWLLMAVEGCLIVLLKAKQIYRDWRTEQRYKRQVRQGLIS